MFDEERDALFFETALTAEARARVRKCGWADIVIGIPTHRNGRTIGEVVQALSTGIERYLPTERIAVVNADGGSSDNTTRQLIDTPFTSNVQKIDFVYQGVLGKGTGVRAILECGVELNAKVVVVLEARAPGITPEWIQALVQPIRQGHDLALGCYRRSSLAAAATDNLFRPFVRMLFNADLREPLAYEYALSGHWTAELVAKDVWETDVTRFGINIWPAIETLADDRHIVQVDLGYRGDGSSDLAAATDVRFAHSVGILFRVLTTHRRIWQTEMPYRAVPLFGEPNPDQHVPCPDCLDTLIDIMCSGYEQYYREWQAMFSDETLQAIETLLRSKRETFDMPLNLWMRILIEAALVYNKGEGDPDKIGEALLPLFYGRAAAYVRDTRHLSVCQREEQARQIVEAFAQARPTLLKGWDNYQPWFDMADY